MPPATGGLPEEPAGHAGATAHKAPPDERAVAGHAVAGHTVAGTPAAHTGRHPSLPGRISIPVARTAPDDHPTDYPGLFLTDPTLSDLALSDLAPDTHEPPVRGGGHPTAAAPTLLPAAPGPLTPEPWPAAQAPNATTPAAGSGEDDPATFTSDRRQFHRIAGVLMGSLLIEGQFLEVSGMLAASPVQLALDRAEQLLSQVLSAHEVIPPAHVLAQTARLHRGLERLARRGMADGQWKRLRVLAGRVAVVRADAAFKQGDVTAARTLTGQAYAAGLAAGDGPLCGSAREVGAVTEFYEGQPAEALRLARDGLRHVTDGPVRARLICQEARALAGLGDLRGAARALDQAYDLADGISPDQWGRPGPSFDEFNPVEVSYNATTALCLLGRPRAAQEHADLALPKLDAMDAPGFRSVIRLDLSLALARAGRLELEQVCSLATDAIQISWGRTVASVSSRADQLLAATRSHGEVPEVRELAALVRVWQRSAATQSPGATATARMTPPSQRTPPNATGPAEPERSV